MSEKPLPEIDPARLDAWFVQEVLPLEQALRRLFRTSWRAYDDAADLCQEVFTRVYKSAAQQGMPTDARPFVFACARNLLIDMTRRSQVVAIDAVAEIDQLPDEPRHDFGPERLAGARAELKLLAQAIDALPPRCREVVMLRKVDGLSQREIAAQLGIAEGTVEKQVTLGIRALAESLRAHGIEPARRWFDGGRVRAGRLDS